MDKKLQGRARRLFAVILCLLVVAVYSGVPSFADVAADDDADQVLTVETADPDAGEEAPANTEDAVTEPETTEAPADVEEAEPAPAEEEEEPPAEEPEAPADVEEPAEPAPAEAAEEEEAPAKKPAEDYPLGFYDDSQGFIQVDDENKDDILGDGKASYDPAANKLTLKGIDLSGIMFVGDGVTVELKAGTTNTISTLSDHDTSPVAAIELEGATMTITGSGTLNVNVDVPEYTLYGIYDGDTVTVDGSAKVNINVGSTFGYDHDSIGVDPALVVKENAQVSITTGDTDGYDGDSTGVNDDLTVSGNGKVTIETGDTKNDGSDADSTGVYDDLTASDNAVVDITTGDGGDDCWGVYYESYISGNAKVDITTGDAGDDNCGIYDYTVVKDQAELNITVGDADYWCGGIDGLREVSGSAKVTVSTGTARYFNCALECWDNLTVSGSAEVTAEAGGVTETGGSGHYSVGIWSDVVEISGTANVSATGEDYGIMNKRPEGDGPDGPQVQEDPRYYTKVSDNAVLEAVGGTQAIASEKVDLSEHKVGGASVNTEPDKAGSHVWDEAKEPALTDASFKYVRIPALAEYEFTEGDGSVWTKGSGEDLPFKVEAVAPTDDSQTFSNFTGITVDGEEVSKDDYTATEGSVNITLKAEYLETLSKGEHTITASFSNAKSDPEASFTVESTEPEPDPDPIDPDDPEGEEGDPGTVTPVTGDPVDLTVFLSLALVSLLTLIGAFRRRER